VLTRMLIHGILQFGGVPLVLSEGILSHSTGEEKDQARKFPCTRGAEVARAVLLFVYVPHLAEVIPSSQKPHTLPAGCWGLSGEMEGAAATSFQLNPVVQAIQDLLWMVARLHNTRASRMT